MPWTWHTSEWKTHWSLGGKCEHIYRILYKMELARSGTRDMMTGSLHPNTQWPRVWEKIYRTSGRWMQYERNGTRSFMMSSAPMCDLPGYTSVTLTECTEVNAIWEWTRIRISRILRTGPSHVPPVMPGFEIWPPQRRQAILWLLAHMVYCNQHNLTQLSLADYADFSRRARLKTYQRSRRQERFGKYLLLL
jgi:hypothetical protein